MNSIETVTLKNVEVQANGIIRNEKGRLIARLVDSVSFESEHVQGLATPPNMNDSEQWRKKFHEKFTGPLYPELESFIEEILAQQKTLAREETAKAFGGCEYCYGKGYGTETIYHGDARTRVIGEKYVPCPKCERGKQIAELLASKEGGK